MGTNKGTVSLATWDGARLTPFDALVLPGSARGERGAGGEAEAKEAERPEGGADGPGNGAVGAPGPGEDRAHATRGAPEDLAFVEGLTFSRCGRHLLVRTTDKSIYVLSVKPAPTGSPGELQAMHEELQQRKRARDLGSLPRGESVLGEARRCLRLTCRISEHGGPLLGGIDWRTASFSHYRGTGAGEDPAHVCAVHKSDTEHRLFLFSARTGELQRVLEGPKPDGVRDAAWHPREPVVVCCSTTRGRVYCWAPVRHENWSAFAPGFVELQQNEEHVESEDEFDLPLEGEEDKGRGGGKG